MNDTLQNIVGHFLIEGHAENIVPLETGHINDSFKIYVKDETAPKYLLQRINHHIFKNVEGLQQNIEKITAHIRHKLYSEGIQDVDRRVLRLIPATDNRLFYQDTDGHYWRMYLFIRDGQSYDMINADLAYVAGKTFGAFQGMLNDLNEPLIETIPEFHNMELRLETFRKSVQADIVGRLKSVRWLVDELEQRSDNMCLPDRLHREGKLPKRINHCDTKVNNMLFDDKTNEVLCVVDLDTVMPDYVLSDFGDFVRTAANTGAEDDENPENVSLDLNIANAYLKGYLEEARAFLMPIEKEYLVFGARWMTYMQTVRFLTDFLDGDIYYKIKDSEHNLRRSLAQFKLLQRIEENDDRLVLC